VVSQFDEDWKIDVKTREIRRKPRGFFRKLRDYFWPRRHNVFALYWWLKHEFHRRDRQSLMAFTFPINHDNMPIPGYPIKYEIVGGWKIPKRDLKFLTKGPLARISPSEVLVPHSIGWERIRSWTKVWGPPIGALSTLVALVLGVIELVFLLV
jgi:hypothetical protein